MRIKITSLAADMYPNMHLQCKACMPRQAKALLIISYKPGTGILLSFTTLLTFTYMGICLQTFPPYLQRGITLVPAYLLPRMTKPFQNEMSEFALARGHLLSVNFSLTVDSHLGRR